MHHSLPSSRNGHAAALLGVALLHGALLWWQVRPQPAVALPQQQVIRVSMVAAPEPEAAVQPVKPAPVTPPAERGMRKREEPQPQEMARRQERKPAPVAHESTGRQSAEATAQHAALTEPVPADYLQNPPPVYPRDALRKRMQGTVMVEVLVSREGFASHVQLRRSSGYGPLDAAALDAVRKWRFIPARRGEEVVEARVVVPVEFRIN